jgi:hypothetical protein
LYFVRGLRGFHGGLAYCVSGVIDGNFDSLLVNGGDGIVLALLEHGAIKFIQHPNTNYNRRHFDSFSVFRAKLNTSATLPHQTPQKLPNGIYFKIIRNKSIL